MKLTELELERLAHVNTKRAFANFSVQIVEREAGALFDSIRARLGFEGDFEVAPGGAVVVPEPVPEPAAPVVTLEEK